MKYQNKNLILQMIKQKCKEDRISQKQVCFGICDPAYISRCISNDIEMDKLMLDAIMQRLGMSTRNYEYILRESEYKYFELREKIRMCIQNNQILEAKEIIKQYLDSQSTMKSAKKMHLQAALLLRSYVLAKEEADVFTQIKNVEEALCCTFPLDYMFHLENLLFSETELLLLVRKAMLLEKINKDQAYDMYYKIYKRQLQQPYCESEFIYIFVVVDYHLGSMCLKEQQYDLVKEIVEIGLDGLSKKINYYLLQNYLI